MAIGRVTTTPAMQPQTPLAPPQADDRFDRLMAQLRRTPVEPARPAQPPSDPRVPAKPDAIIGVASYLRESPTSPIDPGRIAAAVMNYKSPDRPGLLRPDEKGRKYEGEPLKRLDVLTEFSVSNNNGSEKLNVVLNASTRSPVPVPAAEFFNAMRVDWKLLAPDAVVVVQQDRKMAEVPPALEQQMKSTAHLTGVNIGIELKDGRIFVAWANEQKAGSDLPPPTLPGNTSRTDRPVERVAPVNDGKPLPKLDLPRVGEAGIDLDGVRPSLMSSFDPKLVRVAVQRSLSESPKNAPPPFVGVIDPNARPYQGQPLTRIDIHAGVTVSDGELMVSGRPGTRSERFTSADLAASAFLDANVVKRNGFLVFTPLPDKQPEVNPALEKAVGEAAKRNGVNIAVDLGQKGVLIGRTDGTFEWNRENAGSKDPRFDWMG